MKTLLRRIRGAFLMGMAWAVVWAPIAVLIAMILDPDESMNDIPALGGIYPGFLCGAVFSVLLGFKGGQRRLHEVPLARLGAWGALSGLLVGGLPFVLVAAGAGSFNVPAWPLAVTIIPSATFLSAVSAIGSALLARTRREPSNAA